MVYRLVVPWPTEDIQELRVLEWHHAIGAAVGAGELLVELESHKSVVEIRPSQRAVLRRILIQPGDWQSVGQPLALLSDAPDEPVPETSSDGMPSLPIEFALT
jgi:pyruvate/2-oxoglutarate dehydrogenase complex dihydrolipoamide acyltransferase (E2) component